MLSNWQWFLIPLFVVFGVVSSHADHQAAPERYSTYALLYLGDHTMSYAPCNVPHEWHDELVALLERANSEAVLNEAARRLGMDRAELDVVTRARPGATWLTVNAEADEPREAARIANAVSALLLEDGAPRPTAQLTQIAYNRNRLIAETITLNEMLAEADLLEAQRDNAPNSFLKRTFWLQLRTQLIEIEEQQAVVNDIQRLLNLYEQDAPSDAPELRLIASAPVPQMPTKGELPIALMDGAFQGGLLGLMLAGTLTLMMGRREKRKRMIG